MEKDIKKFKNEFQKQIEETVSCTRRSIKDDMKMTRNPELCHQYGMLFNHQGYMMPILQSLQLFLTIYRCQNWMIYTMDHWPSPIVQVGQLPIQCIGIIIAPEENTTSNGLHTKN